MIKEIALLSPIYVTLFWSIVFLIQKGVPNKPKTHLGVLMVLAFILYCSHAVFFSNLYHLYSYMESVYIFSMLSIYPMYYIYILLVTTEDLNAKRKLNHFLPAIIFGTLSIIMTLILTQEQRISYVQHTLIEKNLKGLNWTTAVGIKGHIFFISRLTLLIQVVYYVFMGVKRAISHNKRVSNFYSDVEGKMLHWVRDLNIVILIVAIASIAFTIIGRSYFSRHEVTLLIPSAIFSIILFEIGFKGNQQLQITEEIIEDKGFKVEFEEVEYEQPKDLKKELIELFEAKRIYNQTDLRITSVSDSLKTNRTYISRLINDEFGVNFNEFVNKYRIEEAKKLLESNDSKLFTMEHIAEKSGFGSVNSFTRVFKEFEGITPGQFKNKSI
ncbi:helix-turn-helix transcriptional regulator [Draconibacterium sp.]|nr:helix-turn-helix transcriptional regulator [Draconibacterium sp.]